MRAPFNLAGKRDEVSKPGSSRSQSGVSDANIFNPIFAPESWPMDERRVHGLRKLAPELPGRGLPNLFNLLQFFDPFLGDFEGAANQVELGGRQ